MRLETERLVLRQWEDRDRPAFAACVGDPEVMRFYPRARDRAETDLWIDRMISFYERDGFGFLAIERKSDGAFVGHTGITRIDFELPGNPEVEIGWIVAKEYWGQGYAPEAARACLAFGFETLSLPEIVAFTYRGNLPSQRVMQKLGMVRDPARDFEHPRIPEGHALRSHVLYAMRREAFATPA